MTSENAYGEHGAVSAEDMALAALPLVHRVVAEVAPRLPAAATDDLLSVGLVAVLDAATRFESAVDGEFEVYAAALVRSALLLDVRPSEPGAGSTPLVPDPAVEALRERHRRVLAESTDDPEHAAAQVVSLRAEALMMLRDALGDTAATPATDLGRQAARRASYGAVASRQALLLASSLPDVRDLRREA